MKAKADKQIFRGMLRHFKDSLRFMEDHSDHPEVAHYRSHIYLGETVPSYELTKLRVAALERLVQEFEREEGEA